MSTDQSPRRQKIVMALGIATIILFSANLLTVLAHHFWPESGLKVPFLSESVAEAEADAVWEVNVHEAPHHKHHFVIRGPEVSSYVALEMNVDELDRDIARMERDARRLEREINRELSRLNTEEIQFEAARAVEISRKLTSELQAVIESSAADGEGSKFRVRVQRAASAPESGS